MSYLLKRMICKKIKNANRDAIALCHCVGSDIHYAQIILNELNTFMASLGVSGTDAINKGYDIMMVEKMFS